MYKVGSRHYSEYRSTTDSLHTTLTLDVYRVLGQTVASAQLFLNYCKALRVLLPRERGEDPPIPAFSKDYPLAAVTPMHRHVPTATPSV